MGQRALIVGCGFTGRRAAGLLLERGWRVSATARNPEALASLRLLGAEVHPFDATSGRPPVPSADGAQVLLSVPTLRSDGAFDEPTPRILEMLAGCPEHVTYLSTTGVYGSAEAVDETTPAAPATERQRLRMTAEGAVRSLPCRALALRPAAIYGPRRGVHSAMREGRFRLPPGQGRPVSRIHVDDLASIVAASMARGIEGAFPVADALPATSREVARFCAGLLGLDLPGEATESELSETRRFGRRVDGRAILRHLGLELRYPTYREGIPASIAAERSRP